MSLLRRLRGITGTALTWGGLGVAIGVPLFLVVFRPWPLTGAVLQRTAGLFMRWELGMFLWGVVTGLAFSVVVLTLDGRRSWSHLSARRLTVWGALAGALFPAVLSVRPLQSGSSLWYFGPIIAASAIAGALWARASLAMARRVSAGTTALLPDATQPAAVQVTPARDAMR